MKQIVYLLSLLCIVCQAAPLDSQSFRAAMDAHRIGTLELPSEQSELTKYRYAFVAGFLNEGLVGYFHDNRRALLDFGIPDYLIEAPIYPPSINTVEANAQFVLEQLKKLRQKGDQKLVVIGHSKGSVELFTTAMHAPDFITEGVEALILVQSAFGSGVADYMVTGKPAVDHRMPFLARKVVATAGLLESHLHSLIKDGMESLTHLKTNELLSKLMLSDKESIPQISDKLYFIRGWEEPGHNPLKGITEILKPTAWYLATYFCKSKTIDGRIYGLNDGLVCLEDQSVAGIGTILTTLSADHADLMTTIPTSNQSSDIRINLMAAIVHGLAQ